VCVRSGGSGSVNHPRTKLKKLRKHESIAPPLGRRKIERIRRHSEDLGISVELRIRERAKEENCVGHDHVIC
jgi:hypothetical protein